MHLIFSDLSKHCLLLVVRLLIGFRLSIVYCRLSIRNTLYWNVSSKNGQTQYNRQATSACCSISILRYISYNSFQHPTVNSQHTCATEYQIITITKPLKRWNRFWNWFHFELQVNWNISTSILKQITGRPTHTLTL